MILSYVFWILMSRIATPEIIGAASGVIAVANIFTVVANIGIPNGIQRFLGKHFSMGELSSANFFFRISVILTLLGTLACLAVIVLTAELIETTFEIDFTLVLAIGILFASGAFTTLFRSIIIASLKTKVLSIILIASSVGKFGLSIILLLLGTGALGIVLGFAFNYIISSILLGLAIALVFRSIKSRSSLGFLNTSKDTLNASISSWIPLLITTVGTQLGTIVVFGAQGAAEAGFYFIAFSITNALTAVMFSLLTIAYPALSAMQDGRKRFAWRATKLSMIVALPIASSTIFYSEDVMRLFGNDYAEGSLELQILLLSMLPTAVYTGINALVYSYGKYRDVLAIGLASSLPRTLLYFVLVPIFSGVGAAMGYTVGAVGGFIIAVIIARRIGMLIMWRELIIILAIPLAFGFMFSKVTIPYFIGIPLSVLVSLLLMLKLGIITKRDVGDSATILPRRISAKLLVRINGIGRRLNSTYDANY